MTAKLSEKFLQLHTHAQGLCTHMTSKSPYEAVFPCQGVIRSFSGSG